MPDNAKGMVADKNKKLNKLAEIKKEQLPPFGN
jgi:hypothetical protein